jgi:hypothetical protein
LFIERAKAYENIGQFDNALADLRNASVLEKSERSSQAIQALLKKSAEAKLKAQENESLERLVSKSTSVEITPDQLDSVQRLVGLSTDERIAQRLVKENHFKTIMSAFSLILEHTVDTSKVQEISKGLLQVMLHVGNIKDNAPTILNMLNRDTVFQLVPLNKPDIASKAIILLANVLHGAELESVDHKSESILSLFEDCLKLGVHDDLRIASLNGLIKIISNKEFSKYVFSHQILELVMLMSNESNDKLKGLVPVALARFSEYVEPNDEANVKGTLQKTISNWLNSTKAVEKTTSLLALSALFQANASYASFILISSGVLEDIMEMIEFETIDVQLATIEMLSSASFDSESRKRIAVHCITYLSKLSSGSNPKLKAAASNALVKFMFADKELETRLMADDRFVEAFISNLRSTTADASVKFEAVEALAYLSLRGKVKERIISDEALLRSLNSLAKTEKRTLQYGLASIWANISSFKPRLTDEEKQMLKLREVAGEAISKDDPNDTDEAVTKRTLKLASSGVVAALNIINKDASPGVGEVLARVLLNLSADKRNRGRMVQDGAVKTLITLTTKATDAGKIFASHALARIAITTDPTIAFKGQRAAELIRPLLALCSGENQLQQFEGLLALTNLASFDDDVRTRIVLAKGMKVIEFLQFSDNDLVRRAATEALCNMMLDPTVFQSYADPAAPGRLRMLIALCDVEDFETRRAASGALAILSSHPDACRHIVEETRGLDVMMGLIFGDENEEILLRGVECVKNIAAAGQQLAQKLAAAGAVPALRNLVPHTEKGIAFGAIEALQNLQKVGVDVMSKPAIAK